MEESDCSFIQQLAAWAQDPRCHGDLTTGDESHREHRREGRGVEKRRRKKRTERERRKREREKRERRRKRRESVRESVVHVSMGYDLERFVGYVNEGLLCCVCRDVLERPLQAPCEHAYCSGCISTWLLQHHSCPEDRLPLDSSSLRPLYRYMKNDLSRLQVRCVNAEQGCDRICSLETLHTHEDQCEFTLMHCSNPGCPVQVERRGLQDHLTNCAFRSRACPNGCGHTLLSVDQSQHNCVAVLRVEVEMLRAEMLNKVEEVRREMESRLDSQRRHMVQKESMMRTEVDELRGQLSRVMCDVRALLGAERLRRQELIEAELENNELLEMLRTMQQIRRQDTAHQPIKSQQEDQEPIWREQLARGLQREAAMPGSNQSLSSTQSLSLLTPALSLLAPPSPLLAPPSPLLAPPSSLQLADGPRQALDCIKKKNREVTVI